MKIAINGCGIAGPALAFWLRRAGYEPVLIEKATGPRSGGYVVDFWGIGYDIVEKMGLLPQVRERGYRVGEVRFVDKIGHRRSGFSTDALRRLANDRFTSLKRSDLAAVLFSAIESDVETVFGDSIASMDECDGRVRVSFDHARARTFDLVIGADGLHSRVRHILFGPPENFEERLGLNVAAFEAKGYRPRDELVYVSHTRPGRQISRFSMRDDRTLFLFVFRDEELARGFPMTDEERRAALCQVFAGDGWESEKILAEMQSAREIYFDRVSQIKMESWARGRAALIGDAAACVPLLAGEGAGLAIAEGYVLAGELARAQGNYVKAYAAYQERLRPLLARKQKAAMRYASAFAPRSTWGVAVRDLFVTLLRVPVLADFLVGRDLRDDIRLPHFGI